MSDRALQQARVAVVPARRSARPRPSLAYVVLGLIVIFNVAIFLWLILQALKPNNEFLTSKPWSLPSVWTWSNFSTAWRDAKISSFFGNSILVSFGATALSLVTAVPAAYALSRFPTVRGRTLIRQFFFIGLLMPPAVLIVPLYFELSAVQLLDTLVALIVVYAGLSLPFSVWYLSSFFGALPRELEEAAAIDGASPLISFLKIFLPNALGGCFAVFIVNFLWSWNEFFYALTFLDSDSKFTIALGVFNLQVNAEYSANWVVLFAGMLISVVPILLMYVVLSEQITKAMAQGSVKG